MGPPALAGSPTSSSRCWGTSTWSAPCSPRSGDSGSRLRRGLVEAASLILVVALLIWSLTPVYNMLLIALDPDEGDIEFEGILWPPNPSLHSFHAVVTQGYWLVEDFWRQLANSS